MLSRHWTSRPTRPRSPPSLPAVPKRRLERAEARHAVLTDRQVRQIVKRESSWAGDVLDELLVVNASNDKIGLAPPDYVSGRVRQTLPALNLGDRVFTDEVGEEARSSRPGEAAFWRPPTEIPAPERPVL
jgi:hypothetical protein